MFIETLLVIGEFVEKGCHKLNTYVSLRTFFQDQGIF